MFTAVGESVQQCLQLLVSLFSSVSSDQISVCACVQFGTEGLANCSVCTRSVPEAGQAVAEALSRHVQSRFTVIINYLFAYTVWAYLYT